MPTHPHRPSRKPWLAFGDDPRIIAELLDRAGAPSASCDSSSGIVASASTSSATCSGAGLDFRLVAANPAAAACTRDFSPACQFT
jgi:hypothetical protein